MTRYLKTKEHLLRFMDEHGACDESYAFVCPLEGSFEEIVDRCPEYSWLTWLLAIQNPHTAAAFANRCAQRVAHLFGPLDGSLPFQTHMAANAAALCAREAIKVTGHYIADEEVFSTMFYALRAEEYALKGKEPKLPTLRAQLMNELRALLRQENAGSNLAEGEQPW